jgi:hypothetical protein
VADDRTVWLPAGSFVLEPGEPVKNRILDFNGDLRTAATSSRGIELSYQSGSRAIAVLSGKIRKLEIDGERSQPAMLADKVLALPRGQHLVTIEMD